MLRYIFYINLSVGKVSKSENSNIQNFKIFPPDLLGLNSNLFIRCQVEREMISL